MIWKASNMKIIRIITVITAMFLISCSSTQSSDKTSTEEKSPVVKTAADLTEETVSIYGLIKTDGGNVFVVTNWRSKSMVTYTVTGDKKTELAKNSGKYASVSGVITDKKTWSGTIEVRTINSIDIKPDPQKERVFNFTGRKKGK